MWTWVITNANFLARRIQRAFPKCTSDAALHMKRTEKVILTRAESSRVAARAEDKNPFARLREMKKASSAHAFRYQSRSYRRFGFVDHQRFLSTLKIKAIISSTQRWRCSMTRSFFVSSNYVSPYKSLINVGTIMQPKWHPKSLASLLSNRQLTALNWARDNCRSFCKQQQHQKKSKHMLGRGLVYVISSTQKN